MQVTHLRSEQSCAGNMIWRHMVSKIKNGKSTNIFFPLKFVKMKKKFYHFIPQTTKLVRTYLRSIKILEKIIDKYYFA